MSGKWWTIVSLVVAAKIYLLGSWLWGAPDDALAHADAPAKVIAADDPAAPEAAKGRAAHADEVQRKPDPARDAALDEAAERAEEAGLRASQEERASAAAKRDASADGRETAPPRGALDKPADVLAATPRACLAAMRAVGEERRSHEKKAASLLVRERAVERREAAVKKLLADALALSQRAEGALARAVSERKQGRTERTLRLAKLLAVMKPVEAAGVVGRLATANAVAALAGMEPPRAGKILGALPADVAATISEALLAQPKAGELVKAAAPATTRTPATAAAPAASPGGAAASK